MLNVSVSHFMPVIHETRLFVSLNLSAWNVELKMLFTQILDLEKSRKIHLHIGVFTQILYQNE